MFKALVLDQEEKKTIAGIRQVDESELPEGDVLIDVDYSSLNYKDGLAITGKGRIVRQSPLQRDHPARRAKYGAGEKTAQPVGCGVRRPTME